MNLSQMSDFLWGIPVLSLLVGLNLFSFWLSGFFVFKNIPKIPSLFRLAAVKEGISPFKALMNSTGACVGMGNIAGVAIALEQGGPGALFWMWVAAILGMNTRFYEVVASQIFRPSIDSGQQHRGPMTALPVAIKGLPGKILGMSFAAFALVGTLSLFQINQLSSILENKISLSPLLTSTFVAIMSLALLRGGIHRISQASSILVPFMGALYLICGLAIMLSNSEQILVITKNIFSQALCLDSAVCGGIIQGSFEVIRIGVRRSVFSHEAGVGTASMAHADSTQIDPIKEGLTSSLAPFFDTILICTISGYVFLCSRSSGYGVEKIFDAYSQNLGSWGQNLLLVSIFLFSFTTILGGAIYNKKCWEHLWGKKYLGWHTPFYVFTIFIGGPWSASAILNIMDIAYAMMVFPNAVLLFKAAPLIKKKIFNER